MHKFKRICPGVYRLGPYSVVSVWHPEFKQDMWHVLYFGRTLITHSYLRDAKADAVDRLAKDKGN